MLRLRLVEGETWYVVGATRGKSERRGGGGGGSIAMAIGSGAGATVSKHVVEV